MNSRHLSAVLKDKLFLGVAVLVLLPLGGAFWLLLGDYLPGAPPPRYTHMHCDKCREEAPYNARMAGKKCNSCGEGTYIPTVGSLEEGGGIGPMARVLLFLLFAGVLLQGLAYFGALRLRIMRQEEEALRNRKLICHCPYCKRKLGYLPSRVGTGVVCSRCKTAFTLPAVESAEYQEPI